MFNKDSRLFEEKPKKLLLQTARDIAEFLTRAAKETGAKSVTIIYHGGEPLMVRPAEFAELCEIFCGVIEPAAKVRFTIQTNALLIKQEWIDLFERYHVTVGVSLDGDRQTNDTYRLDHQGRGTYDRAITGARKLFSAAEAGQINQPSALCVIDPFSRGDETFRHLVNDIGFSRMDFLLPIDTHSDTGDNVARGVGRYLQEVFEAWTQLGRKDVQIRFFDNFYRYVTGLDRATGKPVSKSNGTLILTFASDGTFGPDDTLRIVSDNLFRFDCRTTGIAEYLADPEIDQVLTAYRTPVSRCHDCIWSGYCISGSTNGRVVNRYANGDFDRPSSLCEGLDMIYGRLARAVVRSGLPPELMFSRLNAGAEKASKRLEASLS